MYVCIWKSEDGSRAYTAAEAGVIGGCEPPDVGDGSRTQVLRKNSNALNEETSLALSSHKAFNLLVAL